MKNESDAGGGGSPGTDDKDKRKNRDMSEGGDSKDINMKQKDLESSGGYRPKTEP